MASLLALKGWTKTTGSRSRITFYYGDDMVTNYSGKKEEVRPWTQAPALLAELRDRLEKGVLDLLLIGVTD